MNSAAGPRHLAFAVGLALLSAIVVRLMIAARVLDRPDPRKVHTQETPKGGGVGVVVAFLVGIAILYRFAEFARLADPYFVGVIEASVAIAIVAFLDDLYDWKFSVKLSAQILAAVVAVASGIYVENYHIPYAGPLHIGWLAPLATVLWLLFATNALNFIDGLNGLAAGVALIAASFLAGIAAAHDGFFAYFASLLLIAGLAGFLPFNFPRARIFMGDVGSQFCGFILAILAVVASRFDNVELSLGCGSMIGGRLADRLSPAGSVAAFAAAELGIALFGTFSATLFYDVLYRQLGQMSWSLESRAAILFLNLVWPTLFMGASLPLLVRFTTRDIHQAATKSGTFYAVNTLGGAVGALATTWWLLPSFGMRGSLQRCASLNFLVALAAVALALRAARRSSSTMVDAAPRDQTEARGETILQRGTDLRFATWAALYGLSGFLALSLEIVWFRLLGILLKSSAYVFGTLLAHYLTGLGIGAAAASFLLTRTRNPARAFVAMQAAVGVCAGLGVLALVGMVRPGGAWPSLAAYAASPEPLTVPAARHWRRPSTSCEARARRRARS